MVLVITTYKDTGKWYATTKVDCGNIRLVDRCMIFDLIRKKCRFLKMDMCRYKRKTVSVFFNALFFSNEIIGGV